MQVAILSERISNLTEHFKTHAKDNHSRRGMIKMVSQRRGLLDYVKAKDAKRYEAIIAQAGSAPLSSDTQQNWRRLAQESARPSLLLLRGMSFRKAGPIGGVR